MRSRVLQHEQWQLWGLRGHLVPTPYSSANASTHTCPDSAAHAGANSSSHARAAAAATDSTAHAGANSSAHARTALCGLHR